MFLLRFDFYRMKKLFKLVLLGSFINKNIQMNIREIINMINEMILERLKMIGWEIFFILDPQRQIPGKLSIEMRK